MIKEPFLVCRSYQLIGSELGEKLVPDHFLPLNVASLGPRRTIRCQALSPPNKDSPGSYKMLAAVSLVGSCNGNAGH